MVRGGGACGAPLEHGKGLPHEKQPLQSSTNKKPAMAGPGSLRAVGWRCCLLRLRAEGRQAQPRPRPTSRAAQPKLEKSKRPWMELENSARLAAVTWSRLLPLRPLRNCRGGFVCGRMGG